MKAIKSAVAVVRISQLNGIMLNTVNLDMMCETLCVILVQLRTVKSGLENLKLPSDEEKREALDSSNQLITTEDGRKCRRADHEFETLMKHLDNAVCFRFCFIRILASLLVLKQICQPYRIHL